MDELDYFEMRRESVQEHLPRLAYTVSDVLLFVTNNLHSNEVIAKVQEIAVTRVLNGIENADKPCLIIVGNRSARPSTKTSAERKTATEQMLKILDRRGIIRQHYLDVQVVELTLFRDNASRKDFEAGIDLLLQTVREQVQLRLARRKPSGLFTNNFLWTQLFSFLTNQMNTERSISMARTLAEVCVLNKEVMVRRTFNFFQVAMDAQTVPVSVEAYSKITKYAVSLLAVYMAIEQHKNAGNIGEGIAWADAFLVERRKEAARFIRELLVFLESNQPCEGTKDVRPGVFAKCTETRTTHHPQNHFCSVALPEDKKSGFLGRAIQFVKKLFTGTGTRWPGSYEAKTLSGLNYQHFWDMYHKVMVPPSAADPSPSYKLKQLYLTQLSCFQGIIPDGLSAEQILKHWLELLPQNVCCLLCFNPDTAARSLPCGHTFFCHDCIRNIPSDCEVPESLLPEVKSHVLRAACPACGISCVQQKCQK